MNNEGLLSATMKGYTKTLINNPSFYSVSPFRHAIESDVPALQLPIV